ncbi:MAG: hypothetical protein WBC70_10335 [Candidatus Aminicenantales bacterium]
MKTAPTPILIGLLFFVLGSSFFARFQTPAEEKDRMAALEAALRECRIADIHKDEPGRTSPWVITFTEWCPVQRALFRYVDRPRPQPMADSYRYDIAAYELSKLLGVELIPPVVEREIDGRKGTLQIYLENCIREKDRKRKKLEPPEARAFDNAMEELKVFENLAYDGCYNLDDTYIHMEDWRVYRVDFSEAFAPVPELLPGCSLTACSKKLYRGLSELDEEAARATLGKYLNNEELEACLVRRELILEKLEALIAEKGAENVLF